MTQQWDDEEVIAEANRSVYGLDVYGFGGNPAHAEHSANRRKAGTVGSNETIVNYVIAARPFGGVKQSGINR